MRLERSTEAATVPHRREGGETTQHGMHQDSVPLPGSRRVRRHVPRCLPRPSAPALGLNTPSDPAGELNPSRI